MSDYEEYCKYHTDATKEDSDSDGISDGDWEERREYAYTIKALCKLIQPFDVETMNDMFQDVKVIEQSGNSATLEVILYPYASPHILPSKYPYEKLHEDVRKYTESGIGMNYSPEMQEEVKEIVKDAKTDIEAIKKLLAWVSINTKYASFSASPPFMHVCVKDGKVVVEKSFKNSKHSDEEILDMTFYADSMFKRRQHESCGSISTLRGGMLRAAGIPTRLVMTVPLIYRYGDENPGLLDNMQNGEMTEGYEISKGGLLVADHFYNEVFINNHWIRVDNAINLKTFVGGKVYPKITSFGDWDEVDFTKTWSFDTWNKERPYRTIKLSDAYPLYTPVYEKYDVAEAAERAKRAIDQNPPAKAPGHYIGCYAESPGEGELASGWFEVEASDYLGFTIKGYLTWGGGPEPVPMYMAFTYVCSPKFSKSEANTAVESNNETVTVPAGTFVDCQKVKTVISDSKAKPQYKRNFVNGTRYMWFAPGVGLVKLEYHHNDNTTTSIELISYSVSEEDKGYFPLDSGNRWTYEWTNGYRDYKVRETCVIGSR